MYRLMIALLMVGGLTVGLFSTAGCKDSDNTSDTNLTVKLTFTGAGTTTWTVTGFKTDGSALNTSATLTADVQQTVVNNVHVINNTQVVITGINGTVLNTTTMPGGDYVLEYSSNVR